jgi:anti-sigma factor RsiW
MAFAGEDNEHLLHAYLDGELDVATALMVDRQLAADPAMRQVAAEISLLKKTLAERFPLEPLPLPLKRRIDSAIFRPRYQQVTRWALLAASLLIAIGLSSSLTMIEFRGDRGVDSELIDAHLRALMSAHPVDVVSSDQHTVKPWFNGKITQAPRVVDLSNQGFDLVGGRIDVLKNLPAPTLIYRRRQHVISLTELPEKQTVASLSPHQAGNGFNVVGWSENGHSYVAISDLNLVELKSFTKLFQDTD